MNLVMIKTVQITKKVYYRKIKPPNC